MIFFTILGICTCGLCLAFIISALWPCDGDCKAYWDWLSGVPSPACWQCKRKDRLRWEQEAKDRRRREQEAKDNK